MKTLKEIALVYFAANPEDKEDAIKKGEILMRTEWMGSHHYQQKKESTVVEK